MKTYEFFETEPLTGLGKEGNPVTNYHNAVTFEPCYGKKQQPLCYGLYGRNPEAGEKEHLADFFNQEEAEAICDRLNKMCNAIGMLIAVTSVLLELSDCKGKKREILKATIEQVSNSLTTGSKED